MRGALVLLACLSCAAARATDLTVFGLELGKPVATSTCTRGIQVYDLPPAPCVAGLNDGEKFPFFGSWRSFYFAKGAVPPYLRGARLALVEKGAYSGGPLLGVMFETYGNSVQVLVFQALVDKYGQPTLRSTDHLGNALGAKFEGMQAVWQFPDLTVTMAGITSDLDHGLVLIQNPDGQQMIDRAAPPSTVPKL